MNILLVLALPSAIACEAMHAPASWVFLACALAIIPLAGLMGEATEALAVRFGAGIGGLLNATFGNAAELIIALFALRAGLHDIVRASIAGSVIGNLLLVFGLAVVVGGARRESQVFNRTAAGAGTSMMALSVMAMVLPAVFHHSVLPAKPELEHELTLVISIILIFVYILALWFQLRTHAHLYRGEAGEEGEEHSAWSMRKSITVLILSTAGVALLSEFLVGAIEETAKQFSLNAVFMGVILLAIIGNAAEHATAIVMAWKNRMDLAVQISVGSSMQVALFVAPVLVFISWGFGQPLDLIFGIFEILAMAMAVTAVSLIASDGETNWLEGVMLLAVYTILGVTFFFLP